MVRWSEQLAAETDLLRVDFLVQKGGACLARQFKDMADCLKQQYFYFIVFI
jgi:hypothetical protein